MAAQAIYSIIIPAFNAERTLAAAIASVHAQAAEAEIVVVDDGSKDNTAKIAAEVGAKVITQENLGPAAAKNTGIAVAKGEYIGFLDADDWWEQKNLQQHESVLTAHPDVEISIGMTQLVDDLQQPLGAPMFVTSLGAALIRSSVFSSIGLFDTELQQSEDTDWFIRAMEAGVNIDVSAHTALSYRRHDGTLTTDTRQHHRFLAMAIKKSLDRRRCTDNQQLNQLPQLHVPHNAYSHRLTRVKTTK